LKDSGRRLLHLSNRNLCMIYEAEGNEEAALEMALEVNGFFRSCFATQFPGLSSLSSLWSDIFWSLIGLQV